MPKKREPEWIITKGQRSRWQKERRRKRIAMIGGGVIIGIVVILGALAIWDAAKPEPPTMVGIGIDPAIPSMKLGETLDLKAVKVYDNDKTKPIKSDVVWASSATPTATIDAATGRVTGIKEGITTITALADGKSATALLGVIPTTILEVGSTSFNMDYYVKMLRLSTYFSGNDASTLSDGVLASLKDIEVRKQLAPALGITVTEDEVESRIVDLFPDPNNPGTRTYADIRESALKRFNSIDISEEELKEYVRSGLFQEIFQRKIGDEKVPRNMDQVHLRGIVFDVTAISPGSPSATEEILVTPTEAGSPAATNGTPNQDPNSIRQMIKQRLDAGDSFAALAQEYSQDPNSKDSGGDLGWIPQETLQQSNEQLAQIASSLEPGVLSDPIPANEAETNTYYWIIEVLEKEADRALTDEQWNGLAAQAEIDWIAEERIKFTIVDHLDSGLKTWAAQKAMTVFSQTGI